MPNQTWHRATSRWHCTSTAGFRRTVVPRNGTLGGRLSGMALDSRALRGDRLGLAHNAIEEGLWYRRPSRIPPIAVQVVTQDGQQRGQLWALVEKVADQPEFGALCDEDCQCLL